MPPAWGARAAAGRITMCSLIWRSLSASRSAARRRPDGRSSMAYLGQIGLFAFGFAPAGWVFCQGQLVPISQSTQLFSILGTAYGGNGTTVFALPNLPGVPVGAGQGPGLSDYDIGEEGGEATVTLDESQMPRHSHGFNALTDQAKSASPDNIERVSVG